MALSSPSPEIEQLPTSPGCLCQGRFIASLDDIGASWNTGGAALLREARRAGLRFSTGRNSSGGHRRVRTATSRLGLALRWSGASRRARCVGSPRSASVLPRTAWHSPCQCRRTVQPGRRDRRESSLCRHRSSQ